MTTAPREMTVSWSPQPRTTTPARQLVATALEAWRAPALTDTVALVAGELVDNAVEHAGTDVTLTVQRLPDGVLVRVNDGAGERPPSPCAGTAEHGLARVQAVSAGWGVVTDGAGGKAVWALICG